jgi:hypothetical protein
VFLLNQLLVFIIFLFGEFLDGLSVEGALFLEFVEVGFG